MYKEYESKWDFTFSRRRVWRHRHDDGSSTNLWNVGLLHQKAIMSVWSHVRISYILWGHGIYFCALLQDVNCFFFDPTDSVSCLTAVTIKCVIQTIMTCGRLSNSGRGEGKLVSLRARWRHIVFLKGVGVLSSWNRIRSAEEGNYKR
jgi:hypothetical protein